MSPKVLVATQGNDGVTAYRQARPAKHFDFQCDFPPWTEHLEVNENKDKAMKWLEEEGHKYDVLWTRNISDGMAALSGTMREAFGTRIVVDIDDHFEDVPKSNQAHAYWHGKSRRMYEASLEGADGICCSTQWLADRHSGVLAPNFVDLEEWEGEVRNKKNSREVVIACPAGLGRAGDYEEIREPLKAALELPNVKVLFMGAIPSWSKDYPAGKVIYSRWAPFDMYGKLLKWISPDIIVSPMLHNDFNLAKSNLKWLESGAVGACFVGEQWGEYQRTVLNGVTGVLADGESDWTDKLLWLCTEHDQRQTIAAEGAKEIAKNWTWEAVKEPWIQGVLGDGASDDRLACSSG